MALGEGARFGDYRIESVLGKGGMGSVYVAQDTRLDRQVALKVLSAEMADDPGFRDRFVAESRIAASLDHPNIVPVFEAGDVDGQLFLAMRYVRGSDLASILAADGPLDPGRASAIVAQIATALDAAHRAGLVHRDVKPANILVTEGPRPGTEHAYLSDFGLTKRTAETGGLTRAGQVLGTVDYIAPEQIEGGEIDGRADIYSLGCVLYECLAGGPPYRRDTDMAVLYAHVRAPVPSLAEVRPDTPSALVVVVERAMAKAPSDRFQTAGEMAEALSSGASPTASGVLSTSGATSARDRRPLAAAGLIGVVGILAVAVATGTLGGQATASPTPDLGVASPTTGGPASSVPITEPSSGSGSDVNIIFVPTFPPPDSTAEPPQPPRLAPGRHRFGLFDPPLEFTVPEGWWAVRDFLDGAEVLDLGTGEYGSAPLSTIDFGRAQVVYETPCLETAKTRLVGTDPQDFLQWVIDNPSLEAGSPQPVIVGGLSGISVEVDVKPKAADLCPGEPEPFRDKIFLLTIAQDNFWLFDTDRARFIALNTGDGPPVLVVVSGPKDRWDDVIARAQPVLESMVIPN